VGSNAKKRTTMAKLNRETSLRERRAEKQARKAARKLTAAHDAERDLAFGSDHEAAREGEPHATSVAPGA
jgi:hypothetical protein